MSSVDEGEGEMGTLIHTAVGNANWEILYRDDFGNTSKIRYGFTIPWQTAKIDCKKEWVLKKNPLIWKGTHTSMFTAASFTIAKIWK